MRAAILALFGLCASLAADPAPESAPPPAGPAFVQLDRLAIASANPALKGNDLALSGARKELDDHVRSLADKCFRFEALAVRVTKESITFAPPTLTSAAAPGLAHAPLFFLSADPKTGPLVYPIPAGTNLEPLQRLRLPARLTFDATVKTLTEVAPVKGSKDPVPTFNVQLADVKIHLLGTPKDR